jgi:Ca2+-binding RTX toxin-like protein
MAIRPLRTRASHHLQEGRGRRTTLFSTFLVLGLLAIPASALASEVTSAGGVLTYVAATDEPNRVVITNEGNNTYVIQDLGSQPNIQPQTPATCQSINGLGAKTVRCTGVTVRFDIFLGNLDDTLEFTNSTTLPVNADAGTGNDGIIAPGTAFAGDPGGNGVNGSDGADTLLGSGGADVLSGNGGNDIIDGQGDNDVLNGGDGNDQFRMNSGAVDINGNRATDGPNDVLNGGNGVDVADYSGRTQNVTLDAFDSAIANDGEAGENDDINSDVESLLGGSGNDTLIPAEYANGGVIDGNAGSDTVDFGDRVNGGVTVTLDDAANDGAADTSGAAGNQPENMNVTSDNENVLGTTFSDSLTGSAANNLLSGDDGNDFLSGLGGNDLLVGGEGNDSQVGGTGDDTCDSGSGVNTFGPAVADDANTTTVDESRNDADTCDGGDGTDSISYAGRTAPVLIDQTDGLANDGEATEGDNVFANVENLTGGSNNDVINGSGVNNTIVGNAGDDTINAGGGNDTAFGSGGDDTVNGNDGNDALFGGLGVDSVNGGLGDDRIGEDGGANGADTLTGGGGTDIIDYSFRTNTVVLNVSDNLANDGESGESNIVGNATRDLVAQDFEVLLTGAGNDIITGNTSAETIVPGNGSDDVFAGGGDDIISAADGFLAGAFFGGNNSSDEYNGDAGTDTVTYGPLAVPYQNQGSIAGRFDDLTVTLDDQFNDGGAAGDIQEADNVRASVENVTGGNADDSITGDTNPNALRGGTGNDTIIGGAGSDALFGDAGNDQLDGETGIDSFDGGAGSDDIRSQDGNPETVTCGTGTDDVVADTSDTLNADCERRDGPAGSTGSTGPQGSTGTPGAAGSTGPSGSTGPAGSNGAPGPAGSNGAPGAGGSTGPAGPAGTPGARGPTGPAGTSGSAGTNGTGTTPIVRGTPVKVTARLSKKSDLTGDVTVVVTGTIDPGATGNSGCTNGKVSISAKSGTGLAVTVSSKRPTATSSCTFRQAFTLTNRARFRGASRVKFTARFLGTPKLGPRSALPVYIRVK